MTNPINSTGPVTPQSLQPVKKRTDSSLDAPAATSTLHEDRLELSEMGKRVSAQPGFDEQKIQTIRKAIAEGNYPLNSRRIAESFANFERMISDTSPE